MTRPFGPIRLISLCLISLVLVSCGGSGPRDVSEPALHTPRALNPADHRAPGIPFRFGDNNPHEWEGREPSSYQVHGIDASRYQGIIDWRQVSREGISFAWLKATEGGDHKDPGWPINSVAARAAGVPVGAYHFYYFCRTAREQAQWFIQNVPRVPGDLPPVLDMEWNHLSKTCKLRPDPATVRSEIRVFTDIVTRHYGTAPVIYTTPDFYEENDLGSLPTAEFWLRSVTAHPSERYPNERWTFWQYTGTGIVDGIGGIVDLNAFGGPRAAWDNWLARRRQ